MTIAAGFPYSNGVLLCCDSLQEGGAMKFDAPKVGTFYFPAGKIGFAFAGNAAFAVSAVQKCSAKLQSVRDPANVIAELERVHDKQYRRTVYEHPDRATDWSIPYSLLFSYWRPGRGTLLFATHDTTLRSVTEFTSIGIGKELASYLVRPTYRPDMSEANVVRLAAYMLNRVKSYVPGCGGPSILLAMRNDGRAEFLAPPELPNIEGGAEVYDRIVQEMFFALVDIESPDSEFNSTVKKFEEWANISRILWRYHKDVLKRVNPIKPTDPQPPTADRSDRLPSPESPGETDES